MSLSACLPRSFSSLSHIPGCPAFHVTQEFTGTNVTDLAAPFSVEVDACVASVLWWLVSGASWACGGRRGFVAVVPTRAGRSVLPTLDVHAHLCSHEIIGLLAGTWDAEASGTRARVYRSFIFSLSHTHFCVCVSISLSSPLSAFVSVSHTSLWGAQCCASRTRSRAEALRSRATGPSTSRWCVAFCVCEGGALGRWPFV